MEKKTNEVVIEDVDIETLKSMLRFMYSNKIQDDQITTDLLAASDKYEVMRLRSICEEKLSESLCMENVAEVWQTAYMHNAKELQQDSVVFMAANWRKLRRSEKIKELIEIYPHLTIPISALLADDRYEKYETYFIA